MPNDIFQLLFKVQRVRMEKRKIFVYEKCKMGAIVWLDLENKPSAEGSISYSDFQF